MKYYARITDPEKWFRGHETYLISHKYAEVSFRKQSKVTIYNSLKLCSDLIFESNNDTR